MDYTVVDKLIVSLGKPFSKIMMQRLMQSKFGRDMREKLLKDNYHVNTLDIFKAALTDAKVVTNLPDDLFCDLIEDQINRNELFRWVLEGVRPGELDKTRLNVEVYMETYPRYQDCIYPFFITILGQLDRYKKTYWSPEFLGMLHLLNELETENKEGFKTVLDEQIKLGIKQDQIYEIIHDKMENVTKRNFTKEWFGERARENISNIGERYSEDLNLELEASQIIDAIEVNERFRSNIMNKCDRILESIKLGSLDQFIYENLEKIKLIKRNIESTEGIEQQLSQLKQIVEKLKNYLDTNPYITGSGNLKYLVSTFIDSNLLQISLNPFVIISGGAGVGKSHFMADQVSKRQNANKVSMFLLGQLFNSEDTIISQIRNQLEISGDEEMEHVFNSFNHYGADKKEKVIIFVDALNEGRGKRYWSNSIQGFIERVRKYSNIALVMSVRDTYENEIIPEGFYKNSNVNRVEFKGFDDTDKAVVEFFNYYKIPLNLNDYLKYEFRNPLFLKVYCMAYDTHAALGTESVENIFNNYSKKINTNLRARIENYPKHGNLVFEALGNFIDSKLKHKGRDYFLYESAAGDVNESMAKYGLNVNYFDELINEKVITVSNVKHHGEEKEIVYITFELFEEFITAKKIVEANKVVIYTNRIDLNNFFSDKNPYSDFLSNMLSNQGVFESLAVQIPDAVSPYCIKEFEMDCWPKHVLNYRSIDFKEVYYKSLTWRRPEGINGISHSFILNTSLYKSYTEPQEMYDFWDVVLKFTIVKSHYYNADFLYNQLIVLKLDEFNAYWTVYVSKDFDQNDSYKRIINWARKDQLEHSQIDKESIRLLGMNIAWFMASTSSHVRDVSIKVMVALFTDRIDILLEIIKKFRRVQDAYILEALFCVAYGCVMRTRRMDHVKTLAEYINKEFFDRLEVIPHAMIRNYLTGILGFALAKGLCDDIYGDDIKPPFKNRFGYYEVEQNEIIELKKEPSNEDIKSLDPHYQYRSREDVDLEMYYTCKTNIIVNLESCYTNISIQPHEEIYFQVKEIIDYILPEYKENFINMVIKEIFESGYNFVKFGEFEISADYHEENSLGQKYEWIALNKILALYLDSNQYICDRFSNNPLMKFMGVWQFIFLRKIDPSIDYFSPLDTRVYQYRKAKITREDLLTSYRAYFEKSLDQLDWIALNKISYRVGSDIRSTQPFLLNNNEIESFKRYIQDLDNLNGQPFENLYVGEIYWSEAYFSLLREQTNRNCKESYEKRMIDTYIWDINDGAMNNYIQFSILSPLIFAELNLKIGNTVLELLDENGEIASLQLYERNYEDILLIRRDLLVRFLVRSDKVIAWPVVNGQHTKMIIFDGLQFCIA
ncbi:hypothetical protein A8L34_19340 [Bacillus sp. FJAT-27264]|uniref:hypothetical protein n=1 Tax=Paenibacillus sp. (strain DSM 101736 / FJAT-27264) TaxID=1850362 RepID=UPI000807FD5D|nr:hypothetical protein [Bacillus sp. FJAT-27264]OBZ10725.1 hypothetical protein A8L34_19340 [Bacillus sp. FJAT-27264]